ncbi:MAG: hypothetical protein IT452_16515 [Planctomycetia bacterium]|nr:hypothetical protein [Planctomycetia bacterium]
MIRFALACAAAFAVLAAVLFVRADPDAQPPEVAAGDATNGDSPGCVSCHGGIEDMHPWFPVSCVGCHGGDGKATAKAAAHVKPRGALPNDERVVALDFEPEYLRFVNPTNLRVVAKTCGECHVAECANVPKSLHGTTAGHLCDGLYENGVDKSKTPRHGIFDVKDVDGEVPENGIAELTRLPAFSDYGETSSIAAHYRDVPRKSCMQCHVWGRGRAVRGRLGMDGDYRSEGCAACHVTYADDGLTETGDPTVPRYEAGHPLRHQLTSAIPTTTCAHCHYGDASIGLAYRGMAMLPPGAPGGPQVPGSTPYRLNGMWYLRDDKVTPPDVHHEKGMHCIDCHTAADTMGDGNIYGQMEHAVEIECTTCHGTPEAYATLATEKGRKLDHVRQEGGKFVLTSKVDGKEHEVVQAKDVVTKGHPRYSAKAAKAMTAQHAKLECYTCHNGWNVNFFGFHFDRNEGFSQLDILSGVRTAGRVTTLEKVFATYREFRLGYNPEGMIAPYMVGFSTMCTVRDDKGKFLVDQGLPRTAAGLSGMTMVHHQTHTTRPEARSCAECHRSAATWGLGSENYRLFRNFFFVTTAAGLEVVAFDRKTPDESKPVATAPVRGARGAALVTDPVSGEAVTAFVSSEAQGISIVDLRNPAFPKVVGRIPGEDGRTVVAAGKRLYVCEGKKGVAIWDVSDLAKPRELGRLATTDAQDLSLNGPIAYVADGEGGLLAADVGDPAAPKILGRAQGGRGATSAAGNATRVVTNFQYSRPDPAKKGRTPARLLAFVADQVYGIRIYDATEPSAMTLVRGFETMMQGYRTARIGALAFESHVDLGSEGGQIPTEENDYLWFTFEYTQDDGNRMGRLQCMKVTNPERAQVVSSIQAQDRNEALAVIHAYNPPFLQRFLVLSTADGIFLVDGTKPQTPAIVAAFAGPRGGGAAVVEAFPLDRMVDEDGRALKDISHEGARYLRKEEFEKLLRAPLK